MLSLRKLLYKPKKADTALLAQFYYADEDLCLVAAELDSFDGRKNPARCAALVAQLRQFQDHVLRLIQLMMDEVIPESRSSRDYRVKYPEDLIQDGLAGQLWFGAECLAAGSSILNREIESESMRPLARSLTKQLDILRQMLRDQSLRDPLNYTDRIHASFIKFDSTFAEFELSYVSAMVPVKTMKEYEMAQEVTVLFSETVQRALSQGLITCDMIEYYDPALMFTIPRLAIVSGLVIFPAGPLNPDTKSHDMSEMFRPFQSLLKRIRELLWTLSQEELRYLERLLCNLEEMKQKSTTADQTDDENLSNQTHNKTASSSHNTDCSIGRASIEMPATTTSLFNGIANVNDLPTSNISNTAAAATTASAPAPRSSIFDMLSVSPDSDNGNVEQGNNNGTEQVQPNNHQSQEETTDQPTSVIINDQISGIARLIIGSTENQTDQTIAQGPRNDPDSGSRTAESNHQSIQSTQGSEPSVVTSPSQFSFHLPAASQTDIEAALRQHVVIERSLSQDSPVAVVDTDRNRATRHSHTAPDESDTSTESSLSSIDSDSSTSGVEDNRSAGDMSRPSCRSMITRKYFGSKSDSLRSKYRNTDELIQKLFICVSGVADQLQTNFASDLRHILKSVFELHMGDEEYSTPKSDKNRLPTIQSAMQSPPTWIPDSEMVKCCSCKLPFTVMRRRHHCRNCGLIFCGRCSSNSAPLPNYGYDRAVRICNKCYVYRINPFFMDNGSTASYNSTTSPIGAQAI